MGGGGLLQCCHAAVQLHRIGKVFRAWVPDIVVSEAVVAEGGCTRCRKCVGGVEEFYNSINSQLGVPFCLGDKPEGSLPFVILVLGGVPLVASLKVGDSKSITGRSGGTRKKGCSGWEQGRATKDCLEDFILVHGAGDGSTMLGLEGSELL